MSVASDLTKLRQSKFDTRIKIINNEVVEIMQSRYRIFNPFALEDDEKSRRKKRKKEVEEENSQKNMNLERAARRARKKLYDFCACNLDLQFFVTLTLDEQKIDRYDYTEIVKKLNTWLDNNVRRRGLKYVLVAEHHKDGAVHFHGLFNDALERVDSGHTTMSAGMEKIIYNLPRWAFGFSTAIEVTGDRENICKYVTKYITKGLADRKLDKVGGRWFYHGGDLKSPQFEYTNSDFELLEFENIVSIYEFKPQETNNEFRIYTVKGL